jgi:hypothetical protein
MSEVMDKLWPAIMAGLFSGNAIESSQTFTSIAEKLEHYGHLPPINAMLAMVRTLEADADGWIASHHEQPSTLVRH